jgi:adenine-specific DNA-methyltransferase
MPTLNWIGKEAVVNHHLDVAFRTLDEKYTFAADGGDASNAPAEESENKIIHGDNLEALKALLPEYEGRIKCIYIDPPYNTGNENWMYNDNVNSPRIRKWLGQVVGKEAEDLTRHDKWLCMMYPRLKLLQKLLSDDGAIFISIDDNEQANLKLICDEIFGAGNYCGIWHWYRSATPPALSKKIKKNLEYVLCYEKRKTSESYRGVKKESKSNDPLTKKQNNISELYFPPQSMHFKEKNAFWEIGTYGTIKYPNELLNNLEVENYVNKNGVRFRNRFTWSQSYLEEQLELGTRIDCSKDLVISYKKKEYDNEIPRNLIDKEVGVNTTEEAGKMLTNIFGKEGVFDFPKHPSLIEYLLQFREDKNSIILDSFAGSGTTAHAVLNLNKQDCGHRKFILVEMEDYAETITAERVRRVINGYGEGKNAAEGTGGSFTFYELGETVFDENGYLNENIGTGKIREYIWYSETRTAMPVGTGRAPSLPQYFLGIHNGTSYYFYYEPKEITTLDKAFLNSITQRAEQYVIYADNCLLTDEFMQLNHIVFKKIPRDIKKL